MENSCWERYPSHSQLRSSQRTPHGMILNDDVKHLTGWGYACKPEDHLKGHERRHEQGNITMDCNVTHCLYLAMFKRPPCSKVFGSSRDLRVHIKTCTREETEKSENWEFRTNRRFYLRQHEAKHHKKDCPEAGKTKERPAKTAARATTCYLPFGIDCGSQRSVFLKLKYPECTWWDEKVHLTGHTALE